MKEVCATLCAMLNTKIGTGMQSLLTHAWVSEIQRLITDCTNSLPLIELVTAKQCLMCEHCGKLYVHWNTTDLINDWNTVSDVGTLWHKMCILTYHWLSDHLLSDHWLSDTDRVTIDWVTTDWLTTDWATTDYVTTKYVTTIYVTTHYVATQYVTTQYVTTQYVTT
jgi:hypothetical protein